MAKVNKSRGITSVKNRIVPVSEASPYVRALIYGRNGKGKTRTAGSSPNTLVIDCDEEGTLSIQGNRKVDVFPAKSWADIVYAYWFLKEGNHKYKTVVIDTLTQAQNLCMRHILKEAEDRDPNRPASTPSQREWGQLKETIGPQILNFRNLPMHVVFLCQERIDKRGDDDDESSTNRKVPDLSPGVRGIAMASVQIMGRIYMRPVRKGKGKAEKTVWETRMLVGPHEDYETKDRSYKLGHIVRNPTMQMLIEASAFIKSEEN